MFTQLRPAIVLMVLMTLLTGIAYPFAMTGIAGLIFPDQAHGSGFDGSLVLFRIC